MSCSVVLRSDYQPNQPANTTLNMTCEWHSDCGTSLRCYRNRPGAQGYCTTQALYQSEVRICLTDRHCDGPEKCVSGPKGVFGECMLRYGRYEEVESPRDKVIRVQQNKEITGQPKTVLTGDTKS